MFVSFRSEAEAIRQAETDSSFVIASRESKRDKDLILNQSAPFVTANYQLYLDTLVKLVGAKEWRISQNAKDVAFLVTISWEQEFLRAA